VWIFGKSVYVHRRPVVVLKETETSSAVRDKEPVTFDEMRPGCYDPAARIDLDGRWRFQLLPTPDTSLAGRWTEIDVPGCWTMQEFDDLHSVGDGPHYTNVQMPWLDLPPHPPAANPTGVFERDVDVPVEWTGRRIVHARPAGPVRRRLYLAETGAPRRPTGLFLDGHYARRGRPSGARELAAMAGLVRGHTWAYRALREAARAGNWPANTRLVVHYRPSRGQRAIIADIAACGVEVDDRSEEYRWRRRKRRAGRHPAS
jgi:hypothetical protein